MGNPKLNILIIDDNIDDLELYTELLGSADGNFSYNVFTAENAKSGVEIFKANTIDCTFIDYNMPGADGLEVIDMLQNYSDGKQIPMVILTGQPHQAIQAQAARHGAMDYIIKGNMCSTEDLEQVIDKVIVWADSINSKK